MSSIDYSSREINIKIAYFGPGLAGKTTNLQYICTKTFSNERGEMTTIDVADAKVSRLSLLPLSLGEVEGFKVRFNLVTVPGQDFVPDSSDDAEVLLKDVDGVCFVVDSQMERMEANIESSDHLFSIFETLGYDLDTIAYVVQFNKRDLPNALPVAELAEELNPKDRPAFEAVATTGVGVFDTLKALAAQILDKLRQEGIATIPPTTA